MNTILQETKFIMNKYNIKANKSLGQNFLIDEYVIKSIIDSSEIEKDDLIIEIGPGLGTLTKYLLEKAKKVICIELDKKMVNILLDRFSLYDNFEILNQDILKVNLENIIKNERKNIKNVKVVANLPYYITTPIIMKLLEDNLSLESITVMIQKEVADRISALPGERQTYGVYYYAQAEEIIEVGNNSFIPEPEVTSKVIKLNIRKDPPVKVEDKEMMFKIIKNAFTQRRKTLLNVLVNTKVFSDKEKGAEILKKLGIDINARPENLKLEDYANIANLLKSISIC